MSKIKAVLLDIDGTVLNTVEFMYHALEAAFKESNLKVPDRTQLREQLAGGKTLEEVYSHFYPDADIARLVKAHRADQLSHMNLSMPFPNAISTLQKLQAAGIKTAAVSTRSSLTLNQSLEVSGVRQYFDEVISGDQVKNIKPHPEALFLVLKRFGVEPSEAIMVGDTDADVSAGKNAGTLTIGVTTGFRGEKIAEDKPDLVAHDLSEIISFISSQESI